MTAGGAGTEVLGDLLAEGRREEARRRLREAREAGADPPAPEALGARRLGGVGAGDGEGGGESADDLAAWSLPAEMGGGVLLVDVGGWRGGATLVDPDDTLILSFGGIGAAVGSVPLTLHRRSPDGEVEVALAWTFDVGPGSYGDHGEGGRKPEDVLADVRDLLDEISAAGGAAWVRFGDLEREAWDRAAFLDRYAELAREHGLDPMEPETADRENFWVRYGGSVRHDTLDAFARDVFRAREAPRAGEDLLEAAADRVGGLVREATGVDPAGLEVAPDGPRFVVRTPGGELGAWPCTRDEWEGLRASVREELEAGEDLDARGLAGRLAEALALRLAERLFEAVRDGLEDRLAELERRRIAGLVREAVEDQARKALADLLPEGAELEAGVVELSRSYRHGDPEDEQGRGLPHFGLELRCWDPDAAATVPVEGVPPDAARLAREAAGALRRELEGGVHDPADLDG